ncbi:MAG TPA: hypothetical protein DD381_07905 [Lentisphaeria bacterium]|nr:MAG: hypothetical protein A2X47_04470 [Lentisphaerae bacterium GWF2_38_69]HBM16245.1 hypothetical protein [Lentisphaeria bacterium]
MTLAKLYGKKGYFITVMLLVSLICNILALLAPFTTIGSLFSSYSCTLPYSVYLMWEESLYLIAILIAGFSILFPFFKLSCLFYIWLFAENKERRTRLLGFVEPLGKWSMLDIFATCIILLLCNKQMLIYGSPKMGVYFFLAAIFLSILASLIIDHIQENLSGAIELKNKEITTSFSFKIVSFIALLVSIAILILAILYPYLKITSFLLIGYSYSIFTSVTALSNVSIILSGFMLLTMIIFPILHTASLILLYYFKVFKRRESFPLLEKVIKVCSRFNMLDVFILAFIIFLSEGQALVKIEDRLGIVLIGAFIFLILIMPKAIWIVRRSVADRN